MDGKGQGREDKGNGRKGKGRGAKGGEEKGRGREYGMVIGLYYYITSHNHAKMTNVGNFGASVPTLLDRSGPNLARLSRLTVYAYDPKILPLPVYCVSIEGRKIPNFTVFQLCHFAVAPPSIAKT